MAIAEKADGCRVGEALELNSRWNMLIDFVYAILKGSKGTNWNDFYFLLLTRI